MEAANDQANAAVAQPVWQDNLATFIDGKFSTFSRHRDGANGWTDRITAAMMMFNGVYEPAKMAAIREFGGSEVYARLVATKCRGASSLLRDVYLNTDKAWGLEPTPDPTLPDDITTMIAQLVTTEVQNEQMLSGQAPDPGAIRDRVMGLMMAAKRAAIKKARSEAEKAENKIDDILTEGNFYDALADFITDLPLFPFACIKGPIVKITPSVTWVEQKAVVENRPRMFWNRVSPYDVWWTPGISNIADAEVIERTRLARSDLNQLIGLPGYNEENIRTVLREYGRTGYVEANADTSDSVRARLERREDPRMNESGMIDQLEYHGYVQGSLLQDYGLTDADGVADPDLDYFCDVFKIGRYVIKAQISPSLRKRAPYYVTSFEKVPGTVIGNALPDILSDIQDVCNATLRSLVNNLSIASGPQVAVNDDRLAPNEDGDDLYPWKIWHFVSDPMGNNAQMPVTFFNADSHAQELLGVYEKFSQIGDELSAIPRYITGSERLGGAGRTASGLAMLMGNAAKILQTVASNVDLDVMEPSLHELYDMVMLTDTEGWLRGDESIKVLGVNVAVQRETQRQRQLEFLQITANPIDMSIIGPKGRASVLRQVSQGLGLNGDDIVPPDEDLAAQQGGAPGAPGAPPAPPGAPGAPPDASGGAAPPGAVPGQQTPAPAPGAVPQTNTVG
jgi:hypothetical protein